jgi:diaphanous 1
MLNATPKPTSQAHFSSFPMTSHLHNPSLRLVSLHPLLSPRVFFKRVPEIHDEFQRRFFISRTSTVQDLINLIVEELGLTKSLPISGGGILEYVLEEAWLDGNAQSGQSFSRIVTLASYF